MGMCHHFSCRLFSSIRPPFEAVFIPHDPHSTSFLKFSVLKLSLKFGQIVVPKASYWTKKMSFQDPKFGGSSFTNWAAHTHTKKKVEYPPGLYLCSTILLFGMKASLWWVDGCISCLCKIWSAHMSALNVGGWAQTLRKFQNGVSCTCVKFEAHALARSDLVAGPKLGVSSKMAAAWKASIDRIRTFGPVLS